MQLTIKGMDSRLRGNDVQWRVFTLNQNMSALYFGLGYLSLDLACASTLHSPNLPFPHSTCPLRHSAWAWGGNPSRQANQAKSPQAAFMRLAEHKWAARRINTAYWGAAQRAQKLRRSRHKAPTMLWFTLVLVCMICRAWLLGVRRLCLACGFRGAFFRFA